ncbi:MAG TPA: hypothetical protein VG797_04250, partial [Phycisphaerales bacterium]|nr:hypothetical protein [Phycisphaerales bacterium]
RSAVSNAEGMNGVMQFVPDSDKITTYDGRVQHFKDLGWLEEGFNEEPDLAMQRGTLSKILAHALDIDGGVMMRLTNKAGRYAQRELIYMQIMPASTPQQAIGGLEYIGVIQKAQDYKLLREMDDAAKEAAKNGAPASEPAKSEEGKRGEEPEAPPAKEQPGLPTPG